MGSLDAWEEPNELLLAKVKNAPGRIGIFLFLFECMSQKSRCPDHTVRVFPGCETLISLPMYPGLY